MGQRFAAAAPAVFRSAPRDVADDLPAQLCKLAVALVQRPGPTSTGGEGRGVRPAAIKTLIGKGHPEFSSGRQQAKPCSTLPGWLHPTLGAQSAELCAAAPTQDCREYLEHLLEALRRADRLAAERVPGFGLGMRPLDSLLQFAQETRVQCVESSAVAYKVERTEAILGLNIPLAAAVNAPEVEGYQDRQQKRQKLKQEGASAYIAMSPADGAAAPAAVFSAESEEPVRPEVPFEACLMTLFGEETVPDYESPALGRKGGPSPSLHVALLRKPIADITAAAWQAKPQSARACAPFRPTLCLSCRRAHPPRIGAGG